MWFGILIVHCRAELNKGMMLMIKLCLFDTPTSDRAQKKPIDQCLLQ